MPSYNINATPKKTPAPKAPEVVADPPVSESSEPIAVATEEFISIAGLASTGRDNLIAKLREHQEKNAPKEYAPPTPTARQLSQTELELEAGRRTQARHEAQQASRPMPKPEASDGYTTPAFRPGDSVPGFNSKDPAARTLK